MCAIVSSTENLKILIGGCGAIMSLIIGLFQVELIFSLLNDFIDSYLKWQKIDNEIDVLKKLENRLFLEFEGVTFLRF